jgi:DNA-binding protein H-NS
MKKIDFESVSTDELWALHEEIVPLLSAKMHAEKLKLEKRINNLAGKFARRPQRSGQPRPYPKVYPKFRNPELPDQTWSGRGKQPHWIRKLLAAGKEIDDFRISAAENPAFCSSRINQQSGHQP